MERGACGNRSQQVPGRAGPCGLVTGGAVAHNRRSRPGSVQLSSFVSLRPPAGANPAVRRLATLRWLAVATMLALVFGMPTLGVELPQAPLTAIAATLAVANLLAQWRAGHDQPATDGEVFGHLCGDVAAWSAFVYFTGGATNPLISLLLVYVAFAAALLPARYAWLMAGMAILAYTLLWDYNRSLEIVDADLAVRWHLAGMWATFLFSALLIAWFVARLTQAVRERDAALAAAREAALRDERMVALGNLAAGAAHELGTPLSTVAVLAGELARDPGMPEAAREDLGLLRDQVEQCKGIITQLTARAGRSRAETALPESLEQWLTRVVARWRELRPAVEPQVRLGNGPGPRVVAEATLDQAFINLFNNAADANPVGVEIVADWQDARLDLQVLDRGRGIAPEVAPRLGREAVTTRKDGAGLGVVLATAAVERQGGRIEFSPRPGGGTVARVHLPLDRILVDKR